MSEGRKILVIDDEEAVREIVVYYLEDAGYEVLQGSSVDEAESQLDQNTDLILTDVRMPKRTGIDLAESLMKRDLKVPILFMTGYADITLDEAKALGVRAIVPKPIEREDLLNIIKAQLTET